MADVASWASCVGAWLVFGGALHQAALDLQAGEELGDRLEEAKRVTGDVTAPVSRWWLVVPPVFVAKQRKRSEARRRSILLDLSEEDHVRLMQFMNQAFGWMIVGLGALLLAAAATLHLGDEHRWPGAVSAAAVVGAAAIAVAVTVSQARRTEREQEAWHAAHPDREG